MSCNALSRMTVHVAGPRASFLREVSPTLVSVQLLQQKFVIRTSFCTQFRSVCTHVEYIPTHGQEMMFVLQDRPVSSICSSWDPYSAFCQTDMLMPSTCTDKNKLCHRLANRHSILGTLSIPFTSELPQTVLPTRGLHVGVRTNFVQEVHWFVNV